MHDHHSCGAIFSFFNAQISLISLQAILFACYVYADTTCTQTYDNISKPIATKPRYQKYTLADHTPRNYPQILA